MGEFVMPSLGADMDEGTLVEWLVKEGDVVAKGDIVAVVDTTKSAIEVEVFEPGVVEKILVEPGTTVPVGTPLALLGAGEPAEGAAGAQAAEGAAAGPSEEPPSEEPPPVGEEPAAASEPVVASPIVRHLAHEKGVDLHEIVGTGPDGVITREDVAAVARAAAPAETEPSPEPAAAGVPASRPVTTSAGRAPGGGRVAASPLARRVAAELGVDLGTVEGTGARGAVLVADVRQAAAGTTAAAEPPTATKRATAGATGSKRAEKPDTSAKEAATKRAAAMRATIANLMARSKKEIPHYYLRTTVDFYAADAFIRRYNDGRPVAERLLPAAVMLKAAAVAVRKVPEVNGFFVDGAFQRSEHVHLGVAVSLRGGGLVAPAIHDADTLPLPELMAALKDYK